MQVEKVVMRAKGAKVEAKSKGAKVEKAEECSSRMNLNNSKPQLPHQSRSSHCPPGRQTLMRPPALQIDDAGLHPIQS
jgi:hypothetical protein